MELTNDTPAVRAAVLTRAARLLRGRGLYTRHAWVRSAYRLSLRLSGVHIAIVNGQQIEVDKQDSLRLLVWQAYEPTETNWYRSVLGPGDRVAEVGGHIGVFTTLFASLVGPSGAVDVFEPDPVNAALLKRNVARNGHQVVTLHEAAVGSAAGTMRLYRSSENTGDNRLFGSNAEDSGVDVPVVTLDGTLDPDRPIRLVKMDVQGAEPMVVGGMRTLLRVNPPELILLEFWPYGIEELQGDPAALLEELSAAGYELAEMDRVSGALRTFDVDELIRRLHPESRDWVNIVATHRRPG